MNELDREYNEWLNFCEKFMNKKDYKEQRDLFIRAFAREHLKVKKANQFITTTNCNYKDNLQLKHILEGDI